MDSGKILDETDAFRLFPDAIFMDGGKGQVNICEKVLEKLKISIRCAVW